MLDGEDDVVKLSTNEKFDNGITIEFFGNFSENIERMINGNHIKSSYLFTKGSLTLGYYDSKYCDDYSLWFGYNGHRHWNIDRGLESDDIYITIRCRNDETVEYAKVNNIDLE